MKSKRLLQIFIMFMLLISPMGNIRTASASSALEASPDAMVINRALNFWDATYVGYISSSVVEKWRFEFTETHNFTITVSPLSGGLTPALSLLDANDNTLGSGVGTFTSSQPAGTYYIMTYPDSGSGFYFLTIREMVNTTPSVSVSANPGGIDVGDVSLITVSLNNVPAEGYTSAEFTCAYDPAFVTVSGITVGDRFGTDPAAAVNDPQNGSFIFAIAGSNGNKATTSGPVFTFTTTAAQAGQTNVDCMARVSQGADALTPLASTGAATLSISAGEAPTATPAFTETPVVLPTSSDAATSTPDVSATPDTSATPATDTPAPAATDTPAPTNTLEPAFTATATSVPAGFLSGAVIASKPVTVSLFDSSDNLVASVPANAVGAFSLTVPGGTYTVLAVAEGFLSARGSATVPAGGEAVMLDVALIAGDLDGNGAIDEFDAMTLGMNYNAAVPAAADLNNDGVINVLDLESLAANYRLTGPIIW